MECREGSTVARSNYDAKIYLYGGRNTKALNKLETYDPKSKHFKVIPIDQK
jgi:hypothetical protein